MASAQTNGESGKDEFEMEQTNQTAFEGNEPTEAALRAFNPHAIAGESLAEVAHEARNMVAALGLYCDLLTEPGVLTTTHQHYGNQLKMVAAASRRLVDRLANLSGATESTTEPNGQAAQIESTTITPQTAAHDSKTTKYWDEIPPRLIGDLAWELQTNRNLLAALAGPAIIVTLDAIGGALPIRLNSEDLTRVLVNLVKNSVDAMPDGGRIQLILRDCSSGPGQEPRLLLNFEDNGVGIPPNALEKIFESGYTTRSKTGCAGQSRQAEHRGLGLSITRSIIGSAGGQIRAANRDPRGACFQIELPVRS
jgi:signal transduction histidine kinase